MVEVLRSLKVYHKTRLSSAVTKGELRKDCETARDSDTPEDMAPAGKPIWAVDGWPTGAKSKS